MRILYLAAAALTLAVTPALAGGCCGVYGSDAIAPIDYVFPPPADQVTQIYVVNQGPVLSGPGLYTYTNPWVPSVGLPAYRLHAAFPYVRRSPHRWCPGCGGVASFEPPMYWHAVWRSRHHRW
jgi:hypothetical protein